MECGLQWKEITCWEAAGRAAVTHEETMETAIPEYCPDLGRIVETAGQVQIRSRSTDGKTVTVSGAVRLTVLYTSEESTGLRSLTLTVPFTAAAEELRLAACQTLWVTGRLLLCEAQAVTARRIYVRVIPELTVTGYRRSVLRLCTGPAEEDASLRLLRQERTACLTAAAAECVCSAAQEAPAPADRPAPEDLLCSRLYPRVTGCQPVGNKLMVKGELGLSVLYRCREQQLYTYETPLPFSQIVDLPEGAGQGACSAAVQLAGCEVRLLRSEETCAFSVTAELRLLVLAERRETISCLTDLYSIRCDTRVETETVTLPAAEPERAERRECVQHLNFGRQRPLVYITGADCAPSPVGESDERRAAVRLRLLYLDEEGTPSAAERTAELALPETSRDAECALWGAPEVSLAGGSCDIRQVVLLRTPAEEQQTLSVVTEAELLEDRQTAHRPSLVMRRLTAGESLWDVARQYHTDETLIRAVNHLEEGELPEKMLLIPRMR